MRCLALADRALVRGWQVSMVCTPLTASVVPRLAQAGFDLTLTDAHGAIARPAFDELCRGAIVVIDSYDLGLSFEREVEQAGGRLLVMDDLADRQRVCHWLLNAAETESARYTGLVPADASLLLGPRYATVHQDFNKARAASIARRRGSKGVRSVLVSFGSTDPTDCTRLALTALRQFPTVSAEVVLGSAAPRLDAIRAQASAMGATLHVDTAAMPALCARADLALGAAGSSLFERCTVGLPSLIVSAATNQNGVAAIAIRAGAARLVPASDEAMADALGALIEAPEALAAMSARAAELVDGSGADRVLDVLAGVERSWCA